MNFKPGHYIGPHCPECGAGIPLFQDPDRTIQVRSGGHFDMECPNCGSHGRYRTDEFRRMYVGQGASTWRQRHPEQAAAAVSVASKRRFLDRFVTAIGRSHLQGSRSLFGLRRQMRRQQAWHLSSQAFCISSGSRDGVVGEQAPSRWLRFYTLLTLGFLSGFC